MSIDNSEQPWFRLFPLLAGTIAVGTDAWVVAGFLPALAHDMRVTTSAAGLSVTVFALAYAVGAPFLAAAISAQRPRRMIAAALFFLGLANVLCALSAGFGMFLAGRAFAAFAASVVTPSAGVLATRVSGRHRRGRALALVISGLAIATAVGVPASSLLARVLSWRIALLAVAGLAWVAAVLIRLTSPDPGPEQRKSVRDRLAPLAEPRIAAIITLTVVGMAAAYVPYVFAVKLLPEDGRSWIFALLAAYGCGAVVGSLGSGALTDRIGPRRTLVFAYVLLAVSLTVLALRPSVALVIIMGAGWGAASWMQTPAQQHRLLDAGPEHASVTIGTNASALYAGIALGTGVGSALLGQGPRLMCLTAVAIALVALVWNLALPNAPRANQ